MDSSLSNHELRMFYTNERRLFSLLVQVHNIDPVVAVFIIALWLFLEHSGRPDVVKNVLSSSDTKWIRLVVMEAESIIEYLRNPATPYTGGLELTAGLARAHIVIEDFLERRSEIVEFMNGVVADGLRRAFGDLHMLPDHALKYLIELVPLSQQPQATNRTGSSKDTGTGTTSSSGIFSLPRGRGLYSWDGTWTEPTILPRRGTKNREEMLDHEGLRRNSRSLGEQVGMPSGSLGMPAQAERHGRVDPFGRPTHTGLHDQEAGGSYQQPWSQLRSTGEFSALQQLHQPAIQAPTAFYTYWNPVLGWVALPAGAATGMASPLYLPHGVLPLGAEGMGLQPLPEGYLKGGREEQQPLTRHRKTEHEGMQSSETWSWEEEEEDEEKLQQEQSSEYGVSQLGGGSVRTLFVTFSRGFPIEPEVLMEHFTSEYGDIVERVVSEKTKAGQDPVYARIILKSPAFADLVLQGQPKLTMKVAGRDAWVRPYVPRRKKSSSTARQNTRHQAMKTQAGGDEPCLKGAGASSTES